MKQRVPLPPDDSEPAICATDTVVVVGSGALLPAVLHSLRERSIEPVCLCELELDGKAGPRDTGVPLRTTTDALADYPDAAVLLLIPPHQFTLARSQLFQQGWRHVYGCASFLAAFEYEPQSFASGLGWLHFYLDAYFREHYQVNFPNHLVVPSIDIVITEKCSLKCRDCANLMQYYAEPIDANLDHLFSALDLIMSSVDHVLELRVLGGEPLMSGRLREYMTRLRQYGNYSRIVVFTNGTIVPRSETIVSLASDHTLVRISDYGVLSRRIHGLTEALEARGVAFEVEAMPGWQPCGTIARRSRTPEESTAVFLECCANTILTLLHQRLYQCPFAANAYNLEALPRSSTAYVDLRGDVPHEEVRGRLSAMLSRRTATPACDYCGGRRFGDLSDPVAEQVSRPRPYLRLADGLGGRLKENP